MIDNGNGTVTDEATGLMWQQETPKAMTYFNADTYCGDLTLGGYTDWRLPTITELQTLVDHSRCLPAINTKLFPGLDCLHLYFISSSPCDCNDQGFWGGGHGVTWGVEFDYGHDFIAKKIEKHHFKAVRTIYRAGQAKKEQLSLNL
jgi:hypothetical protein